MVARFQERPYLLDIDAPKDSDADRDKVAYWLQKVQCSNMGEVIAAEQRALEILTRRKAHLKAVSALLVQHGTLDKAMLSEALGKAANPAAAAPVQNP